MKKNNYVELLRFIFCVLIFLHHCGHVTYGSVAFIPSGGLIADAYFMLTGYFLFRHIEKKFYSGDTTDASCISRGYEAGYAIKYTLKKIARLYPFIAFGTIIIYLLELAVVFHNGEFAITEITIRLREFLVEMTLLPLTGLLQQGEISLICYRNSPMWYMSALLLTLPVFMYLAIRKKNLFKYYLVWFVPPILQAWMVVRFGGVLPWTQFAGILNSGLIRCFSSLCMGGMVYYGAEFLAKRYEASAKNKTFIRILATVGELALLGFFLFMVIKGVSGMDEVFPLYLIAASFMFTFSGITFTGGLGGEKFFGFLGRLSLPIYCIHWGVYRWVSIAFRFSTMNYWIPIGAAFACSVIVSVVLMLLSDKLIFKKKA